MAREFVSGLALSRRFFEEVLRERADRLLGRDRYAACLVGPGSEVLGLDTERSTDHDWGPRAIIVVDESLRGDADALSRDLPAEFAGHSLHFGACEGGAPWVHPVDIVTVDQLFRAWVGFNPLEGVSLVDWLAAPSNGLLMLTAGEVFHDGVGDLTAARRAIDWYPRDVWLWLLACQWRRIGQEQAFVGRVAEAGDDLGSRLLAGRLVRDAVRLAFLVERRHAPYSKWLVAALGWLSLGDELRALFTAAIDTADPTQRQRSLAAVYGLLARATNALGFVPPVDVEPRQFHSRPYVVGPADEFAHALLAAVSTPELRPLSPHGAFDQLIDSTDAGHGVARTTFRALLSAHE